MAEVFTGVSLGRTLLEAGLWHTGGKAYEPAMATSKICQLLKGMVSTVSGVSLATYQEQKREAGKLVQSVNFLKTSVQFPPTHNKKTNKKLNYNKKMGMVFHSWNPSAAEVKKCKGIPGALWMALV